MRSSLANKRDEAANNGGGGGNRNLLVRERTKDRVFDDKYII